MAIEKNPRLAEAGRRGGLAGGRKGGHARMSKLSPIERSELARFAAQARWADPIKEEVISKFKRMREQMLRDGIPQYFYFDGRRAWHAHVNDIEESVWDQWRLRCCTLDTTVAEIVSDALSLPEKT